MRKLPQGSTLVDHPFPDPVVTLIISIKAVQCVVHHIKITLSQQVQILLSYNGFFMHKGQSLGEIQCSLSHKARSSK